MNSVFGDTSYFLAMLVPTDANHAAARRWAEKNTTPIVTSDYVLLEIGNFLSPASARGLFAPFLQAMRSDRRVKIIGASADLLERGIDLFCSRPDKNWSLTDCISFVIMNDEGIHDALTAGHHFEQAGFAPLLKK